MKEIKLTKNKVALVDDQDFDFLNQWKWYAHESKGEFYARREKVKNGKRTVIYMHRFLMRLKDKDCKKVDHKNHNTLDNQKHNLRFSSHAQNMRNRRSAKNTSSKYLGVSWCNTYKKWKAAITHNYKLFKLGSFDSELDAAIAYNKKAIALHGEFANLNPI